MKLSISTFISLFLTLRTVIECRILLTIPPLRVKDGVTYRYYVIQHYPSTWDKARIKCQTIGSETDLARIASREIINHVVLHTTRLPAPSRDLWIGGKQLNEDWKWLTEKEDPSFSGSPDNNSDCAVLHRSSDLYAEPCNKPLTGFLCQLPAEPCAEDAVGLPSSCTVLHVSSPSLSAQLPCVTVCEETAEGISWFGARSKCQDKAGDLVSLNDDRRLMNAVVTACWRNNINITRMWVGLRRNPWAWVGNESHVQEVERNMWSSGEPRNTSSGRMALKIRSGSWVSYDEESVLDRSLCQEPYAGPWLPEPTTTTTYEIENYITTPTATSSPQISWWSQGSAVVAFALVGVVALLAVVVAVLIVCLRRYAKNRKPVEAQQPVKTYFDYFDVGFFRRLMPRQPVQTSNTVFLTDDMIKDGGVKKLETVAEEDNESDDGCTIVRAKPDSCTVVRAKPDSLKIESMCELSEMAHM